MRAAGLHLLGLLALCCVAPSQSVSHSCSHDAISARRPLEAQRRLTHGQAGSARKLQPGAPPVPLRFTVEYGEGATGALGPAVWLRSTIMPSVTARLSAALSLPPMQGPLFAHRGCIGYNALVAPALCFAYESTPMCEAPTDEAPDWIYDASRLGPQTRWSPHNVSDPLGLSQKYTATTLPGRLGYPDTDFVLLVTAFAGTSCRSGGILAFAFNCERDEVNDRPTIARINVCPSKLNQAFDAGDLRAMRDILTHEVIHGLGFTAHNFLLFRKPDGSPRSPRDPYYPGRLAKSQEATVKCEAGASAPQRKVTVPSADTAVFPAERGGFACALPQPANVILDISSCVARLATPGVVAAARAFFACDTLTGGELENSVNACSSDSVLGSHWESRVSGGEIMTSILDGSAQGLSAMTLAVLADAGWGYVANYSAADAFSRGSHWGYGQGCAFAQGKCITSAGGAGLAGAGSPPHFLPASAPMGSVCSIDRRGFGLANVYDWPESLLEQYQYFPGSPRRGGNRAPVVGSIPSLDLLDFCPAIHTNGGSATLCTAAAAAPLAEARANGYVAGSNSICLATTLLRVDDAGAVRGAGCYAVECRADGSLAVTIAGADGNSLGATAVCAAGAGIAGKEQMLTYEGFVGGIQCPDVEGFCFPRRDLVNVPSVSATVPGSPSASTSATVSASPPASPPETPTAPPSTTMSASPVGAMSVTASETVPSPSSALTPSQGAAPIEAAGGSPAPSSASSVSITVAAAGAIALGVAGVLAWRSQMQRARRRPVTPQAVSRQEAADAASVATPGFSSILRGGVNKGGEGGQASVR